VGGKQRTTLFTGLEKGKEREEASESKGGKQGKQVKGKK
jgi:hypothetical protein